MQLHVHGICLNKMLRLFTNILIRGLTLLGKFLLIFFIAKYLSVDELGSYGVIVVFISYSLYAVGLDFYTYSTRELLNIPKTNWGGYIRLQGRLLLFSYGFTLPILLLIAANIIDSQYLIIVGVLIILEHLNQEGMRLLIIDGRVFMSNNLQFIRGGAWCYIVIGLFYFNILQPSLLNLLLIWIIFDFIAFLIAIYYLKINIKIFKSIQVPSQWLLAGIRLCMPLLISTLVLRSITTFDRIWLESMTSIAVVGVYTLFFGLSNSLISFLETGLLSYEYPKLVKNIRDFDKFSKIVKKMVIHSILILVCLSVVLILILPILLKWIQKDIYFQYISMFYIVLAGSIIYCLSMIPHYILYAAKQDKKILAAHTVSFLVFCSSTVLLQMMTISLSVVYGVLLSFVVLFLIKFYFAKIQYNELSHINKFGTTI